MSLPNIGKLFGRDHTTVMNSINKIEHRLLNDSVLDFELKEIIKEVTPNM